MALRTEKLSDFKGLKAKHLAYGRMNEGHATSCMQAELEILQKVALGDHASFKELYTLYAEKVYNTALGFVQNAEDAEEISQEVFVRVFRNAGKFQGNSKLSTWIYRIAVNESLTYLKKRSRFSFMGLSPTESLTIDYDHPGVQTEQKEKAKILLSLIHTLPESQKTAVILCYLEFLPRKEVAKIMETSVKAVESLLMRAKKKLAAHVQRHFPEFRHHYN